MQIPLKELTKVESIYEKRKQNYWLLFGRTAKSTIIYRDEYRAKQVDYLMPESLFCIDLWECNDYGTTAWRVIIARTISAGRGGHIIPNVAPAVRVLLDVRGSQRSKAVLHWIRNHPPGQDICDLTDAKVEIANLEFNSMSIKQLKQYAD